MLTMNLIPPPGNGEMVTPRVSGVIQEQVLGLGQQVPSAEKHSLHTVSGSRSL